jgi:hypothetical protein
MHKIIIKLHYKIHERFAVITIPDAPSVHNVAAKRRRAVLWIMANVVHFRTQQRWNLTLQDFMDFMLRSRWKLTQTKRGRESVGNYLKIMDMGMERIPPPPPTE